MKKIIRLSYSLFILSIVDGEVRTTNFKHKAETFDSGENADSSLAYIKRLYSKMECLNPELINTK